eukprot:611598-Prymnesium_polylepis.1
MMPEVAVERPRARNTSRPPLRGECIGRCGHQSRSYATESYDGPELHLNPTANPRGTIIGS